MGTIRVYPFTKFDITTGESTRSGYYATAEAIKTFGGVPDEAGVIELDEKALDGEGRYRPKGD